MSAEKDNSRNCLLIAMPQLADPNFFHTVSVLVSFDQNGAFGLILNRPIELTLEQVIGTQVKFPEGAPPVQVYFGGPVQVNSLWLLHGYEEFSANTVRIVEGLFLTTDLDVVQSIVDKHLLDEDSRLRFLLGYAGWAPGQLENEISLASWITEPVDTAELFQCPASVLWDRSLSRLGIQDPTALVSPHSSGAAH